MRRTPALAPISLRRASVQHSRIENWSETSIHASQAIDPVRMAKRIARAQSALCVLAADGDHQRLGSECLRSGSRCAKQAAAQAAVEHVVAMHGHEGCLFLRVKRL
jgi:hypothetical protein